MRTEASTRVGAADVLLLGTIAGYAPDADRVRDAFLRLDPDAVALGVPPEDVVALAALAAGPKPEDFPEPDPQQEHLLRLLERFGPTRVPSPDLEAAYALATARQLPVHSLDLDDAEHARRFTQAMGFRHVVRHNHQQRRLLREQFADVHDPHELACAFDARLNALKPLRRLEEGRAAHMAERLRTVAEGRARVLAVVPVQLLAPVEAALTAR